VRRVRRKEHSRLAAKVQRAPTARRSAVAIWPSRESPVSVATWLREISALGKIHASPPPFPTDAVRGAGEPVIVIPGFCSAESSTLRLREFLTRQGFDAHSWESGSNIGPTATMISAFERKLKETAETRGRPVALVGVSLGGIVAREIAKSRPEWVSRVVTLVSPIRLPVATPLAPLVRIAMLVWNSQGREAMAHLADPPPCPVTAIVNPTDGVVDWRACLPDPASNVEVVMVAGAHMTMCSNPEVQRIVASRLACLAPG
jgi:hypothetical protein